LKRVRSSIGAVALLSISTKSGRSTAATISEAITIGSVHPERPPLETP
jgi:hypothetical protein